MVLKKVNIGHVQESVVVGKPLVTKTRDTDYYLFTRLERKQIPKFFTKFQWNG